MCLFCFLRCCCHYNEAPSLLGLSVTSLVDVEVNFKIPSLHQAEPNFRVAYGSFVWMSTTRPNKNNTDHDDDDRTIVMINRENIFNFGHTLFCISTTTRFVKFYVSFNHIRQSLTTQNLSQYNAPSFVCPQLTSSWYRSQVRHLSKQSPKMSWKVISMPSSSKITAALGQLVSLPHPSSRCFTLWQSATTRFLESCRSSSKGISLSDQPNTPKPFGLCATIAQFPSPKNQAPQHFIKTPTRAHTHTV